MVPNCVWKFSCANGSVFCPVPDMMTSGVMTSFQVPSAVRMATVACIGFIIGNTTLQYVVHVLAPSMSAASNRPGSIPSTPDIRRRVVLPNHIHHRIREISPRLPATVDRKSKFELKRPQFFSVCVMGPYCENSALNNTETDAAVIILGRYTITFMAPVPFTFTF